MAPPVASDCPDCAGKGKKLPDMLCRTCEKAFTHRSSLRRHLRTHAGLGIYHCCGKAFQDSDHLKRHRATHHEGPKNHVCTTCGRSFATRHQLAAHERSENSNKEIVTCTTCRKTFNSEKLLKQHEGTHALEKRYRCSCGKAYTHMPSLSRHSKSHDKK